MYERQRRSGDLSLPAARGGGDVGVCFSRRSELPGAHIAVQVFPIDADAADSAPVFVEDQDDVVHECSNVKGKSLMVVFDGAVESLSIEPAT